MYLQKKFFNINFNFFYKLFFFKCVGKLLYINNIIYAHVRMCNI